jgi:hypothetical protein
MKDGGILTTTREKRDKAMETVQGREWKSDHVGVK